mgnify:FL=1
MKGWEMPSDIYKAVSSRIEADWYPLHEYEWFTQDDICRQFVWKEPQSRQAVSKKLYHDSKEKTPPFLEKKSKAYRIIDKNLMVMDWQSADINNIVPIKLPFSIHEHCIIYPKSIIVVAGDKNEGKTAFLYETVKLNMGNFIIDLFNSETGREQMKKRFAPLDIPEPAPFNTYERYDNYADVMHPDHLSIIDYLDINSEFYLVGAEINTIFKKLTSGVAIIGLQKPPPTVVYQKGVRKEYTRDLAYGGGPSAWRAVLYISMGGHKLKLLYVKTPAGLRVNPNNMTWTY